MAARPVWFWDGQLWGPGERRLCGCVTAEGGALAGHRLQNAGRDPDLRWRLFGAGEQACLPQSLEIEVDVGIDNWGGPAIAGDDMHVMQDRIALHHIRVM